MRRAPPPPVAVYVTVVMTLPLRKSPSTASTSFGRTEAPPLRDSRAMKSISEDDDETSATEYGDM